MKNKILVIKNLKKCFHFDKGITVALDGINLDIYKDEFVSATIPENNLLQPVFRNGVLLKEESLYDIRDRLHKGEF